MAISAMDSFPRLSRTIPVSPRPTPTSNSKPWRRLCISFVLLVMALVLVLVGRTNAQSPPPQSSVVPPSLPAPAPTSVTPILRPPAPTSPASPSDQQQTLYNIGNSSLLNVMMTAIARDTFIFDVTRTSVRLVSRNATSLLAGPDPAIANSSVIPLGVLLPLNNTFTENAKRDAWLQLFSVMFGMQRALAFGNATQSVLGRAGTNTTLRVFAPSTFDAANGSGRSAAAAQFLLKAGVVGVIGDGTPEKTVIPAALFALHRVAMCSPQPAAFTNTQSVPRAPFVRDNKDDKDQDGIVDDDDGDDDSTGTQHEVAPFFRPIRHLDMDVAAFFATATHFNWKRLALIFDESRDDLLYITRSILRSAESSQQGGIKLTMQSVVPHKWSPEEVSKLCATIRRTKSMVVVSVLQTNDATYLVGVLDKCGLLTKDRVVFALNQPMVRKAVPVVDALVPVFFPNGVPKSATSTAARAKTATATAKGGAMAAPTRRPQLPRMVLGDIVRNRDANVIFLPSGTSPFTKLAKQLIPALKNLSFPAQDFSNASPIDTSSSELRVSQRLDETLACGYTLVAGFDRFLKRTNQTTLQRASTTRIRLADFNQTFPGFTLDPRSGDLIPRSLRIDMAAFAAPPNVEGARQVHGLWVMEQKDDVAGAVGGMRLRPYLPTPPKPTGTRDQGARQTVGALQSVPDPDTIDNGPFDPKWDPPIALGAMIADTPPMTMTNPQYGEPVTYVFLAIAGVALVIVVSAAVALVALRHSPPVRTSTPLAGVLVCMGAVLKIASAVLYVDVPNVLVCQARESMVFIGQSLIYSALLAKTYRIYKVFHAQKINTKVTLRTVVKWTIWVVAIECVLVALYLVISRPAPVRQQLDIALEFHACVSNGSTLSFIVSVILVSYNVGLTVIAGVLAIKNRNVYHRYNESQLLAITIYNDLVVVTAMVAFTFSPGLYPYLTPMFQGAFVYLAISKVGILLGPVFYRAWTHHRAASQRDKAHAAKSQAKAGDSVNGYGGGARHGGSHIGLFAGSSSLDATVGAKESVGGPATPAGSPPKRESPLGAAASGAAGSASPDVGPVTRRSPGSMPRTLLSLFAAHRDSSPLDATLSVQLERLRNAAPPAAPAAALAAGSNTSASSVSQAPLPRPLDARRPSTVAAVDDVVWAPIATRVRHRVGWRAWWVSRAMFGFGEQWRQATVVFAKSDGTLRVHWGTRVLIATRGTTQASRPGHEDEVKGGATASGIRAGNGLRQRTVHKLDSGAGADDESDDDEVLVHVETAEWAADLALQSEWEANVVVRFFSLGFDAEYTSH
ncbi:7 transmembrane sweet-taste receptor of 3 GCPR-domain-containing protein [Catenaria anguillulae PL171]|uniref:7 transmembrane sweet-taste receptor of 3 GCPR-domain-containing protein n=1 Tax=Catenaria anguillulae PL171 TaxID=765915 RepID=A0A1Y2HPZ7_9FUNG|nr:7 transmembrane sweet-taste receptor of 3 GCPR-domain-containing protein [Catenaria anguillulae PL171]